MDVLKRAHAHRGASFVEVFQNCVVFNDGVFEEFTDKAVAPERQLHVRHGEPLLFGADRTSGLRLKPGTLELEIVTLGADGVTERDVLRHDERNRTLANLLVSLAPPAFPQALGVLYCDPAPTYEAAVHEQITAARQAEPAADLAALMRRGPTWTVAAEVGGG